NNTVCSQTGFVIYRFSYGGGGSGTQIGDSGIDFQNNLILATGDPVTAENDANSTLTATFGPTLWGGAVKASVGTPLPSFPQAHDVVVAGSALGTVVANPTYANLTGLADAIARYTLASGSPARGAGAADGVPYDATGAARSATTPSLGAME